MSASKERQGFLLKLSDDIRAQPDEDAIGVLVTQRLADHLRLDRCYLARLYPQEDRVVVGPEYRRADLGPASGEYRLSDFPEVVRRVQTQTVVFNDVAGDPALTESDKVALGAIDIGAFVTAGVRQGDERVLWALIIVSTPARVWQRDEVELVENLAERVWAAVERTRAETALRESEERYRSLFNAVDQGLAINSLVRDESGRVVDARFLDLNPAYEAQTGFERAAAVGRLASEVFPQLESFWLEMAERVVATGQPERQENFVAATGRWFAFNMAPFGGQDCFTVLYEDISERRQSEAALRDSEQRLANDLANAKLLRGLAERLVTEENVAAIYDEILSVAMTVAGADAGTVQLLDHKANALSFLTTRNFSNEVVGRFSSVDASSRTACGVALRTGRRAFVDFADESEDAGCLLLVDAGIQTALAIPLVSRVGRPLGMLNVHWQVAGHRSTERQLQLLDLIARQTADLIEQRNAQGTLRESEERLRQFGEASQDILWIRDATTLQWTYLTPAFETIYGLERETALSGDNYRNWQDLIVPEDLDRVVGSIARVGAGEHVTFEYRIQRPSDGEIRWLRNTDFPITDAEGNIKLIGGVGHDVTQIKLAQGHLEQSEERLRSAAEVARLGLWNWDISTGEVHWSDEHFRMVGYEVGEVTPSFEEWGSRLHPDDRAQTEAALRHAMEAHEEYVREFRTVHPDGSVHWLNARGRFFYDDAGHAIRMVGAMVETTERREWEEHQKVLVAELQHRTRNLMGVVRSMADKTIRASADLAAFRGRFRDRLEALSRVQGLLSRLDDYNRVTFDDLIRAELFALNGSAERVTLEGPPGVRLRSSTVQTLAMALHELATNAIKYGALGQPTGQLAIRWSLETPGDCAKPWLHIDWLEAGVNMPAPGSAPHGTGQGRELIERALPYQLSAKTTYTLGPDGVHCTISIPVSASTLEEHEHG